MFLRGQRFVITESNTKGRTHPKIGDCGYIRNVVLFLDTVSGFHFTMVDAYFFKFYKDKEGRCEKKRFVLSNDLDAMFKMRLLKGLTYGSFIVISSLILDDALGTLIKIERNQDLPVTNYLSLFSTEMNKLDGTPRVFCSPSCSISSMFPNQIHTDKWNRRAWMSSIEPTIVTLTNLIGVIRMSPRVNESIKVILERRLPYIFPERGKRKGYGGPENTIRPDTSRIIREFHFLQSFILSVINSTSGPEVEPFKKLLELRRRHNGYNAALNRVYEAV